MKFFAVCLITSLIAAVAENADKQTEPALDKLAVAFAKAFNAKDAAQVASFYADDAIVMPPDQTMIRGRRDIEMYYVRGFRQDVSNFRLLPMESRITGSHAFEAGTSALTERKGVSSLGEPALVTTGGKYVVIYRRVNGQWKIAYDIFNND